MLRTSLYWTILDRAASDGGQILSQSTPPSTDLNAACVLPCVYMTRGSTGSISKTLCVPELTDVLFVPVLICFHVAPQSVDFQIPSNDVPR